LKLLWWQIRKVNRDGRDTQKTQHGIETLKIMGSMTRSKVETLRKPSTGLKRNHERSDSLPTLGRDTQKTQHGIETLILT